ncbi:MAG: sensor histidine kinase [Thermodesulfobacteriota bacterium]
MSEKKHSPDSTGIQFFGRVSASISHEIKNVLAIMNENAGLLEDFVMMAGKGVPLSNERLDGLAMALHKQIQRADGIVIKMNQFAHSADRPMENVDLYDAICLVTDICSRMVDLKGVNVNTIQPASPVMVNTHRFYVQNMLWSYIEGIMTVLNPEDTLQIETDKIKNGAEVIFSFEAPRKVGTLEIEYPESAPLLISYLDAEHIDESASGTIRIRLPEKIC